MLFAFAERERERLFAETTTFADDRHACGAVFGADRSSPERTNRGGG